MSNTAGSKEVCEVPPQVKIPKLSKFNYAIWKVEMEKHLKREGLWGYVDESEIKPPYEEDPYDLRKQGQIRPIIKKNCGAWVRPYIEGKQRASSVWRQLETMFKNADDTSLRGTVTNYTWWPRLYKAIKYGDLRTVNLLVSKNESVLTSRLTSEGENPLHLAVRHERIEIVKKMVEMMEPKQLEDSGKYSKSALHIAASVGNLDIVKVLVERHKDLAMLNCQESGDEIPLTVAARVGIRNKDVVYYLYPITLQQDRLDCPVGEKEEDKKRKNMIRAGLLTSLIFGNFFALAIHLLERHPNLVLEKDAHMDTALGVLSTKPSAFQSSFLINKSGGFGMLRNHLEKIIYSFLDVVDDDDRSNLWLQIKEDVENSSNASQDNAQGGDGITVRFCKRLPSWFCRLPTRVLKLVPSCKVIYEKKLKHHWAKILLQKIWIQVSQIEDLGDADVEDRVVEAMFRASALGITEFILEVIHNCPQLLSQTCPWFKNREKEKDGQTIFHYAISNRQEKIFNLIHKLGPMEKDLIKFADNSKNSMLHLAAKLAPTRYLNQVPGPALQVQHELLWYKKVEKIMPPTHEEFENSDGKSAAVLFTEQHKDIVKDGAAWMKETATQCMVVATLITTIMFATVFTVPGIRENDTAGKAKYVHEKFSIVFVSANILALCSSVASVLMFLAIITSRYAEEDFLNRLPRMLIIALFFLFISIAGMMIEFITAVLVLVHYNVFWVSFPIVFLASVPITIYALVEFPLFIELAFATTGVDIFE